MHQRRITTKKKKKKKRVMGVAPSTQGPPTANRELNKPNGMAKKPLEEEKNGTKKLIDEPHDAKPIEELINVTKGSMDEHVNGLKKFMQENGSKKHSEVNGLNKSSDVNGSKKHSEVNGLKKSSDVNGSKKNSEENGSKKPSEVNGLKKYPEENGSKRPSEVNGSKKYPEENGSKKPSETNGSKKPMEQQKKVPHMYEAIMKEADMGSTENHIHSGIFLNNKRKKFWVEEKTGHNCFMLFARDMSITWSDDMRYWHWVPTCDAGIDLASLLNVCWLEVHAKFNPSYLTPGVTYDVAFLLMIKEPAYGWETPINLRLKFADGKVQEHKECLHEKPRGQWIELKVGEIAHVQQKGEVEISLFEYEAGHWKRGLTVKGIIIRPKK